MIYADTSFFLAMIKHANWMKHGVSQVLREYHDQLWTSEATLIELLLLAREFSLDPRRLLVDAMAISSVDDQIGSLFLTAADMVHQQGVGVFNALHTAYRGHDEIVSLDKIIDKLGLDSTQPKP